MKVNLVQVSKQNSNAFPSFLDERIRRFYDERVNKSWGGQHIMRGKKQPGENAIQLTSNDYLSLANHPEILNAQSQAVLTYGNGILQSGIFLYGDSLQREFEDEMASFLQSPRTILCQSGWNANVGLIQTIASATVPVYVDQLAHMSLWEGVTSAGATGRMFRHNDVAHLIRQMNQHGPGIVVIDSVYSTNGSVAPLVELVDAAEQGGSVIVVDESHSLGTHGPQGRGLVVEHGLTERVHFRTASLAKAFAGRAGIITCSEQFADYFMSTSRPTIFSSVLLPHEVIGLYKTLEIIQRSDDRRQLLRKNADVIRLALDSLGYNVDDSQSQIISIEPGIESRAMQVRDALTEHDVFGSIFCAPATAKNRALIRLSVHANLTIEHIEKIVAAFSDIREKIRLSEWSSTQRKNHTDKLSQCA